MNKKERYNINNENLSIAEIGINHNGDLELAKKLILLAKKQILIVLSFKRDIHLVYTKEYCRKKRQPMGKYSITSKEGLELGKKEYDEIDRFCKENKIDWFASAWI